ncbi:MAG: hypothetical protein QME90_05115, partial [Thermodesulfobacteriota bacterium]|nr:hypothetical protein [Thermodesulfobacteriota bacterium]
PRGPLAWREHRGIISNGVKKDGRVALKPIDKFEIYVIKWLSNNIFISYRASVEKKWNLIP